MDDGQPTQLPSYSPQAQMPSASSTVWSPPSEGGSPGYPAMNTISNRQENVQYASDAHSPQFQPPRDGFSTQEERQALQLAGLYLLPQIDSGVGPSRVLTRRQARAAQAAMHQSRVASGNSFDGAVREGDLPTVYYQPSMSPPSLSRPQTPNGSLVQPQFPHAPDASSLATPDVTLSSSTSLGSPPYPSTPLSATSTHYSPFGFFRHSRSGSNTTSNARSASPALSTVSALTSISSHSALKQYASASSGRMSPTLSREKQKKGRLTNKDRREICEYHIRMPAARQEDIANMWHVERSTISKILKAKAKWLASPAEDDSKVARHKPSKFPEIEREMENWLREHHEKHRGRTPPALSDQMIRSKAKQVARELNIPEDKFKASSGWVENFKHRHNIRRGVWCNRQLSPPQDLGPVIHTWSPPSGEEDDPPAVVESDANSAGPAASSLSQSSVEGVAGQHEEPLTQPQPMHPSATIPSLFPSPSDHNSQAAAALHVQWQNTATPAIDQVFQLHAPSHPSLDHMNLSFDPPNPPPGNGLSDQQLQPPHGFQDSGAQLHLDERVDLGVAASFMQVMHHQHVPTLPQSFLEQQPTEPRAEGQVQQHQDDPMPDITGAERSLEYLLQFFDSQPEGAIISAEEREKLDQIRSRLYARVGTVA